MKRGGTSASSSPWTSRTGAVTRATALDRIEQRETAPGVVDAELARDPRDRALDRPVRRQRQQRPGDLASRARGSAAPSPGAARTATPARSRGSRSGPRRTRAPPRSRPSRSGSRCAPRRSRSGRGGVQGLREVVLLEVAQREEGPAAAAVAAQVRDQDVVPEAQGANAPRSSTRSRFLPCRAGTGSSGATPGRRARRRSRPARPAGAGCRDGGPRRRWPPAPASAALRAPRSGRAGVRDRVATAAGRRARARPAQDAPTESAAGGGAEGDEAANEAAVHRGVVPARAVALVARRRARYSRPEACCASFPARPRTPTASTGPCTYDWQASRTGLRLPALAHERERLQEPEREGELLELRRRREVLRARRRG